MTASCDNNQRTYLEFRGYFETGIRVHRNARQTAFRTAAVTNDHHVHDGAGDADVAAPTAVSDDEDEQEQSQFDSQEMEALVDRNTYVASKRLKYHRVSLRSLESGAGSMCKVQGEFMYTDPWWELSVKIKRNDEGTYKRIQVPPKYRLRSDDRLDQGGDGSVIYQFLHKCGIEDELKVNLMQYLRDRAKKQRETVNFTLLRDVIDEPEEIEDPEIREMICKLVKKRLDKSVHYHVVKNAMDFPLLLERFPSLLHKHLPSLIEGAASHEQLKTLEEILREKPYLFGFSYPIRQETNLCLPEVHYDTFQNTGFLPEIDETIRNALFVYCALKERCARYGNTYCWLSTKYSLKRYIPKGRKTKVIDFVPSWLWEKVLDFLRNDIIKAIEIDTAVNKEYYRTKDRRLFVRRYYWAEINIARSIKSLMMEKHEFEKCGHCRECLYEKMMRGEISESETDLDSCTKQANDEAIDDDSQRRNGTRYHVSKHHLQSVSMAEQAEENIPSASTEKENGRNWQQEMLKRQAERDQESFKDDMDQHTAAKSIRENPFTLIIGRGGCGKTHVVCEVMKEFCGADIVMAAPTGKAASNLGKKYKVQSSYGPEVKARTLHQIIFSYGVTEEPDEWDFRDTDILVVDECSMVSVVLLSRVLKLLTNLKKVILMGDYRQLPAIDCGNLLGDLYKYFKGDDVCVELKTNHRAESQHIINCAIQISNEEMPDLNASEEFCHIDLPTQASVERQKEMLKVLSEGDAKDHETSQFVAYTRNNCKALNDWCCPLYAGHKHLTNDGKSYLFLEGDKICPTRNANITDLQKKSECELKMQMEEREKRKKMRANPTEQGEMTDGVEIEEKDQKRSQALFTRRLCNGEIFFIRKVHEIRGTEGKGMEVVTLDDLDEKFNVPMNELMSLSHICHAWARTIHTYQGSESDVVIYWLGEFMEQTWQHVYTAVTRGKKKVIIIGKKDILLQAISNPAKVRYTVLQERLQQNLRIKLGPGITHHMNIGTGNAAGVTSRQILPYLCNDNINQEPKFLEGNTRRSILQPSTSGYTSLKSNPHLNNSTKSSNLPSCRMPSPQPISTTGMKQPAFVSKNDGIQDSSYVPPTSNGGKSGINIKNTDVPSSSFCIGHETSLGRNDVTIVDNNFESYSEQMSEDWPEERVKLVVQMEAAAQLQQSEESFSTEKNQCVVSLEDSDHDEVGAFDNMDKAAAENVDDNGAKITPINKYEGRKTKLSRKKNNKVKYEVCDLNNYQSGSRTASDGKSVDIDKCADSVSGAVELPIVPVKESSAILVRTTNVCQNIVDPGDQTNQKGASPSVNNLLQVSSETTTQELCNKLYQASSRDKLCRKKTKLKKMRLQEQEKSGEIYHVLKESSKNLRQKEDTCETSQTIQGDSLPVTSPGIYTAMSRTNYSLSSTLSSLKRPCSSSGNTNQRELTTKRTYNTMCNKKDL